MKKLKLEYFIQVSWPAESKNIKGGKPLKGTSFCCSPQFKTIEEATKWMKEKSNELQNNDL